MVYDRTVGFSDVSYDEALRRARELIPFLREQAPKCEAARRLTPEVMDALHRTGLLRYLQPKVWGGMELPFVAYFDIPEMLSRGDISVGWTVANLGVPPPQPRVVGPEGAGGSLGAQSRRRDRFRHRFPAGPRRARRRRHRAHRRVEFFLRHRSFRLEHARLHRARRRQADRLRFCLLHRSQYEVIDDWHTLGMRATSSKTVRCKDVFVPAYRVLSMHVARPGHSWPGLEVHRNPHYRIPISALGGNGIGGCLVGNARAALETTIELVKSRSTSYTGAKMRDFQTVQLRIARRARKSMRRRCSCATTVMEAQRIYDEGGTLDIETRLRYKRNCAFAAKDVRRSRRFAARDGGRQRHLRPLSAAAHVPRPARRGRPLQLQHRCATAAVGARGAGRRSSRARPTPMALSSSTADFASRERLLVILAVSAVLASFFFLLGRAPLFDVDEGAFSQATLEMFQRGDFLSTYLNGNPRYDKPILIYWLQAAGVVVFGVTELAFRLPSAICAALWALAHFSLRAPLLRPRARCPCGGDPGNLARRLRHRACRDGRRAAQPADRCIHVLGLAASGPRASARGCTRRTRQSASVSWPRARLRSWCRSP